MKLTGEPTLAMVLSGAAAEDWMEPVGMSLEALRTEVAGGWFVNYIVALRQAGIQTVLITPSRSVTSESVFVHEPTGAKIVLLPSPRAVQVLRRTKAGARVRAQQVHEVLADHRTFWRTGGVLASTPMRAVRQAVRHHGCDAILCQEYEHPRFDQLVLLGRLLRIPVFAVFQGVTASSRLEGLWRPRVLRRAAGLIIPSRLELDRVRRRYDAPPPPLAHVLNPLDVGFWRPGDRSRAREMLGLDADARVVAWHGRVYLLRKGLDVLLEAWDLLSRRATKANLVLLLLGTGPDARSLRRLISQRRLEGIRWKEAFVNDPEEIRRHLWAADVFAFPSRREGLPVAPMEAMACGLPVVAADAVGAADLLEDGDRGGGLLVEAGDAEALARGLEHFLFDEHARRAAGAKARQMIESSASFELVSERLGHFLFANGLRRR